MIWTYTLVEFPVAASGDGGLVSSVHLGDVVTLDLGDFVLKWYFHVHTINICLCIVISTISKYIGKS